MKCPLRHGFDVSWIGKTGAVTQDCLKEECAWWNENDEECSIKLAASFIAGMGINLAEIKNKMPHGEQFRR